jgi:divalent metal cation (Fe/Co/Zn/Cd) transporter
MKGPGRPTKASVEERRKKILLYLVVSTATNDAVVKQLTAVMDTGERAIRSDLEALKEQLESCAADELPRELMQAIDGSESYADLKTLVSRVMTSAARGEISKDVSDTLLAGITAQRHLIHAEEEHEPVDAVRALELLTPEEEALLAEHRKKLAGPPVQPGEVVPPPGGAL